MTKEQAYQILNLDINKIYSEEEVIKVYTEFSKKLVNAMNDPDNRDNEETIKQLHQIESLITEAKNIVINDIRTRTRTTSKEIKKYEAMIPFEEPIYAIDPEGSKKNKKVVNGNLIKIIAGGLVLLLVGTGIGYLIANISKKNKDDNKNNAQNPTISATLSPSISPTVSPSVTKTVKPTPSVEEKKQEMFTLLGEINEIETTSNKEDKELLEKESRMLKIAKEIESELTDAEKTEIILVLDDNYARGMNQIKGMKLEEEEGLISLSYLNGIAPSISGAQTDDITLDFILDFETYWNKLNYDAKKYLSANIECKNDDYSKYGDLVSNYILDEKDALVIGHMIKQRLKVNKYVHENKYDEAYNLAIKLIEQDVKMYTSFEDLKINGKSINVGTLSPWAQYLINFIAYADTGYVEDDTIITTINDCVITNANATDKAYHYDADLSFIMQNTARNNINWHLEANSINAYNAFIEQSTKTLCK